MHLQRFNRTGRRTPSKAIVDNRTRGVPKYEHDDAKKLAKEIAMRAFNLYGDFDPATGDHFRQHGMPDDYVAFQAALEAINVSRGFSAALPVLNTRAKPDASKAKSRPD